MESVDMCGIAGIAGPLASGAGQGWLDEAVKALHHRGPDGNGTWRDDDVGLGHTRLAILDLSASGAQPMHSADDGHVIVYNGEVYNFDELRKPLVGDGWQARGHSDSELILENLARRGVDMLADLNGMFGLAWWDRRTKRLVLARDRVGIKPLYWAQVGDSIAFSSELAPLARLPGVDNRIDPEGLSNYLALGMMPAPFTMLRGVRQLEAGCWMAWQAGESGPSWTTPRRFCPAIGALRETGLSDTASRDAMLQWLIESAVKAQLVADVPVGVLLSGGVDSSVVAAAAARARSKIRTFSVVHDDPAHDEGQFARAVARHLGTEHIEIEMPTGGLTRDELDELVLHHGDPFADSSSLPTRRLAREVRKHVTVALSGDGGDELFAGYPRIWQGNAVEQAARAPSRLRKLGLQGATALTRAIGGPVRGASRRVARALSLTQRPPQERAVGTITYFWPDETRSLLHPQFHARPNALIDLVDHNSVPGLAVGEPDGMHRMEQRLNLPGDMLTKVDRMTMAASLEIRPPLLDNTIVEFAAGLPIEEKVAGREGKAILKRLARRWVPPEVVDRPKRGFSVPLIDYGGAVLADATGWAFSSDESPLKTLLTDAARCDLVAEFARSGEGISPEDSVFRRAHRQWTMTVLALALRQLEVQL